jgi:hypothetical protein
VRGVGVGEVGAEGRGEGGKVAGGGADFGGDLRGKLGWGEGKTEVGLGEGDRGMVYCITQISERDEKGSQWRLTTSQVSRGFMVVKQHAGDSSMWKTCSCRLKDLPSQPFQPKMGSPFGKASFRR